MPLGIDIGTARTRIALVERDRSGARHLIAVASAATGSDPVEAVAAARAELQTRERRCVLALGGNDSVLRASKLPPLRGPEQLRAARFEAARFAPFPIRDAVIRTTPLEAGWCVIGAARRTALDRRVHSARNAGLKPVAVDDAGLALARVFPDASVIVDLGHHANTLIVRDGPIPRSQTFEGGGAAVTAALIAALGIDEISADQRKRSIGLAGAGEHARDAAIERLSTALVEYRSFAQHELDVTLVGNGARLGGLAEALARTVAIPVRIGALGADISPTLPCDVVRAGTPDWALAYGLALWEHAA
jgi:Tfp pilus assembly PilM family ATPase